MLQRLLEAPRRYFRSRGFGVHSPFAFRFINDVLRMRSRYSLYCYPEVNAMLLPEDSGVRHATLRLWARLAAFSSYADVMATGKGANEAIAVARIVGRSMIVRKAGGAALRWIGNEHPDPAQLIVELCNSRSILLLHRCPQTAKALRRLLPYGMTFTNRIGITIVVASDHLPRQDFNLYF